MAVEIQKQKPMPKKFGGNGGRPMKYPWLTIDVGDAFKPETNARTIYRLAASGSRSHAPRKFSARATDDGVWIWRTA